MGDISEMLGAGQAASVQTQALYRRWRSQSFGELVGQEHVTRLLLNALRQNRLAHAYLLCGPRGTGKTSTARILAKAANCETSGGHGEPCNVCATCRAITSGSCLDVIEIDAASNRGIDDIRILRDGIAFAPSQGRMKFYIVDEAHQLTKPAFDALLKTLEEPPAHVVFVLASTSPDSIPITIRSRCQRLDFRPIPYALIVERLELICAREGHTAEQEALLAVARASEGSLRDAESLLDQLLAAASPDGLTVADVEAATGVAAGTGGLALVERLVERDAPGALRILGELADRGSDFVQLGRDIVRTLRALLLVAVGDDRAGLVELPREERERAAALAVRVQPDVLARWIRLFALSELPQRALALPQLGLEIACVEALAAAAPPEAARPADVSARTPPPPAAAPAVVAPAHRPTGAPSVSPAPVARDGASSSGTASTLPAADRSVLAPAASAPATAPDAEPSGPRPAGEDVEDLLRVWPQILERVGQRDRRSQAVLRDSRVVSGAAGRLVLGFRYDFHRAFFEDPKRRMLVEEVIAALCEARWRIECTRVDASTEPRSTSALDDPLVREALATMGGRIKNVSRTERRDGSPAPDEGDEGP